MTAPTRSIPMRYFMLLREAMQASDLNALRILQMAGVDEQRLHNHDSAMTAPEVHALIGAAQKVTGREDLGFEWGRRLKINSHDLLGYGLLSCSTMDELLRLASRHYHLMGEAWNMAYRRWALHGEVVYTPTVAIPPHCINFYLEALALAHQNQAHVLLGQEGLSYDIHLSMPPPAHLHRYLALAPVRFHFHESAIPSVRVVMGIDLLDKPLLFGNPEVVRQIDERCRALGHRPPKGVEGWSDYVTMVLREAKGAQVTLEDIARQAKVSARTIDRHLKQEGLGFRELSDKVRFERACALLTAERGSITQVAMQLGFSDVTAFSRAFKRVLGVSPAEHIRVTG